MAWTGVGWGGGGWEVSAGLWVIWLHSVYLCAVYQVTPDGCFYIFYFTSGAQAKYAKDEI